GEGPPDRFVGDELVAAKVIAPEIFHIRENLGPREVLDFALGAGPSVLGRLDDPGGEALVVLILAENPDSVLVLAEMKREGGAGLGRAEPDEFVAAPFDFGLERVLEGLAHAAVDAVGADDEVRARRQRRDILDLGLEFQFDAERRSARVQDLEKLDPPAAAEAVACGADDLALPTEVDVVPIGDGPRA